MTRGQRTFADEPEVDHVRRRPDGPVAPAATAADNIARARPGCRKAGPNSLSRCSLAADPPFDLEQVDRLLTTTKSVRKRLDLTRPVEREVIAECIRLASYAPNASNAQEWRWVVV